MKIPIIEAILEFFKWRTVADDPDRIRELRIDHVLKKKDIAIEYGERYIRESEEFLGMVDSLLNREEKISKQERNQIKLKKSKLLIISKKFFQFN